MTTRRLGVAVAVLGGYLYAIGGSDGQCPLNTVERYDSRYNICIYIYISLGEFQMMTILILINCFFNFFFLCTNPGKINGVQSVQCQRDENIWDVRCSIIIYML